MLCREQEDIRLMFIPTNRQDFRVQYLANIWCDFYGTSHKSFNHYTLLFFINRIEVWKWRMYLLWRYWGQRHLKAFTLIYSQAFFFLLTYIYMLFSFHSLYCKFFQCLLPQVLSVSSLIARSAPLSFCTLTTDISANTDSNLFQWKLFVPLFHKITICPTCTAFQLCIGSVNVIFSPDSGRSSLVLHLLESSALLNTILLCPNFTLHIFSSLLCPSSCACASMFYVFFLLFVSV